MTATGIAAALLGGFAEFAEFFHYGLDEFFGVGEFLGDHTEVHGRDGGVAHAGAVDAVLADEDERVGDAVEGDGQAAAVAPEALLEVLELVVVLLECRHEGSFGASGCLKAPASEGVRYMSLSAFFRRREVLPSRDRRALHIGHRAEARIFTLPQPRKIIQLSRSHDQKAAPYL